MPYNSKFNILFIQASGDLKYALWLLNKVISEKSILVVTGSKALYGHSMSLFSPDKDVIDIVHIEALSLRSLKSICQIRRKLRNFFDNVKSKNVINCYFFARYQDYIAPIIIAKLVDEQHSLFYDLYGQSNFEISRKISVKNALQRIAVCLLNRDSSKAVGITEEFVGGYLATISTTHKNVPLTSEILRLVAEKKVEIFSEAAILVVDGGDHARADLSGYDVILPEILLKNYGVKLYYLEHPRVRAWGGYKNIGFEKLNSALPFEFINLDQVLCIIGVCSTCLLTGFYTDGSRIPSISLLNLLTEGDKSARVKFDFEYIDNGDVNIPCDIIEAVGLISKYTRGG